jgi:hypothetical protein
MDTVVFIQIFGSLGNVPEYSPRDPDFDPQDIRWSAENIKLEEVERGYIGKKRREVWVEYMKNRIDIEKYEK